MLTTTFVLKWWLLELWGGGEEKDTIVFSTLWQGLMNGCTWISRPLIIHNHPLLLAVIVAQFNEKEHVPCWICKVSGQNEIRAKLYCEGLFESV